MRDALSASGCEVTTVAVGWPRRQAMMAQSGSSPRGPVHTPREITSQSPCASCQRVPAATGSLSSVTSTSPSRPLAG